MMADLHDFAQHVGLHSMDMSSPALPMPQLNRASRCPYHSLAHLEGPCWSPLTQPKSPCYPLELP